MNIKGVVLAGGRGTRLWPITKVVSKHLFPVGDKPVIYYPIMTLKNAGIKDVLIICGSEHTHQYMEVLGSGKELGVKFSYTIQREPGGIAQGLGLAKSFADGNPVALILGDNIFGDDLSSAVKKFSKKNRGGLVVLKQVSDPKRFGVAKFDKEGGIIKVIEKPKNPPSNWAVTGFYLYDNRVFDVVKDLKPSARGEYEITDVNNFYINEGTMDHIKAKKYWVDAGTFESLHLANLLVRKKKKESYTYDKIREKYPSAYRSWSPEEDDELRKLFKEGTLSTSALAEMFSRHKGAIRSRIKKLGLRS